MIEAMLTKQTDKIKVTICPEKGMYKIYLWVYREDYIKDKVNNLRFFHEVRNDFVLLKEALEYADHLFDIQDRLYDCVNNVDTFTCKLIAELKQQDGLDGWKLTKEEGLV